MSTDDQYKNLKEPTPDSFPHFEEESWKKMEALLDKHLPEDNGKPFLYILLFSCLILICLTTFLPATKQQQSADVVTTGNTSVLPAEPAPISEEIKQPQQPPVTNDLNNNPGNQQVQTSEIIPGKEHRSVPRKNALLLTPTEKRESKEKEFTNNRIPDVVFEELLLAGTGRAVSFNRETNLLLPTSKPVTGSSLRTPKEKIPAPNKPVKKNSLSLTFSTGLETPGT